MYLFRYILFCAALLSASTPAILAMDDAEEAGEEVILRRTIQTPAVAMTSLFNVIQQHEDPYTKQELQQMDVLMDTYKGHLDTPIATDRNTNSRNCLAIAVAKGQFAIVKMLLGHGSSVRAVEQLHHVNKNAIQLCPANDIDIFITLLKADDKVADTINTTDQYDETVLHSVLRSDVPVDIKKQRTCWAMYYDANPTMQDNGDMDDEQGKQTAFDIAMDESFFSEESDRQDIVGILHKDPVSSLSYKQFLREQVLAIQGNTASYIRNRQITGPWKGAQRFAHCITSRRAKNNN